MIDDFHGIAAYMLD